MVGLEIRKGQVLVDGVPFERVNRARQIEIAVKVAQLRAGNIGLIVALRNEGKTYREIGEALEMSGSRAAEIFKRHLRKERALAGAGSVPSRKSGPTRGRRANGGRPSRPGPEVDRQRVMASRKLEVLETDVSVPTIRRDDETVVRVGRAVRAGEEFRLPYRPAPLRVTSCRDAACPRVERRPRRPIVRAIEMPRRQVSVGP